MRWSKRPTGSNWGDFGPDDQIGRMNLLTPELRMGGIREVTEGLALTLSLPLDYPGGETPTRRPPQAPTPTPPRPGACGCTPASNSFSMP